MEAKIIEFMRENIVMHDLREGKYRNFGYKWKELSDELNVSVNELKKKWKYLRDGFYREDKKRSLASGSPRHKGIPWKHYESLLFLKSNRQKSRTYSNEAEAIFLENLHNYVEELKEKEYCVTKENLHNHEEELKKEEDCVTKENLYNYVVELNENEYCVRNENLHNHAEELKKEEDCITKENLHNHTGELKEEEGCVTKKNLHNHAEELKEEEDCVTNENPKINQIRPQRKRTYTNRDVAIKNIESRINKCVEIFENKCKEKKSSIYLFFESVAINVENADLPRSELINFQIKVLDLVSKYTSKE